MVDISMGKFSRVDDLEDTSVSIYTSTYCIEGGIDGSARFQKLPPSDAGIDALDSINPLQDLEGNHRSDDALSMTDNNSAQDVRTAEISAQHRLIGWTCLFLAIMSGSLIGPMFRYIQNAGIAPILAASWRCQCMSIFLSALAIFEWFSSRANRVAWMAPNPNLNGRPILLYVCIAGMGWAGNLLLWVSALRYTTVVRAGLAASMHPVFLIGYLGLMGQPLSFFEWAGTFITVAGLFVAAANDLFGGGKSSVIGDMLGLISAICQVVVILNRQKIKKFVPLWQYSAATTMLVAVVSAIVHIVVDSKGANDIFCVREDCVFGWMGHRWLQTILLFSLVVSICIAGYNYSIQFVSPLVFSTVVLVDPAVAGFIAWVAGLEGAPPILSWVGGAFIVGGIFYVTIGEYMRKLQYEGIPVPTWILILDFSYWLKKCSPFRGGYENMNQAQQDDSRRGLGEVMVPMDVQSSVDLEMMTSVHSQHHNSLSTSDTVVDVALVSSEQPLAVDGAGEFASSVVEVPEILLDGSLSPHDGSGQRDGVRRRLSDATAIQTDDLSY